MITLFEKFTEYEIGDYVLLAEDTPWCAKVAKILNKKINTIEFFISTFFLESGVKFETWVNYSEIEKKITFEEYKSIKKENFINYKMKKNANKYNI